MKSSLLLLAILCLVRGLGEGPGEALKLPAPAGLDMSLGEALRSRKSTRAFDPGRKVSREELSALLWAASGLTRLDPSHPQGGKRTSPSSFEAYVIDVYVTSEEGTFLYSPKDHSLVPHAGFGRKDLRAELPRSEWLKDAPLLFVLVANLDRYPAQVRPERRRDYSHADAAAIGENIYLAAAALKLGTTLTADAKPEASTAMGFGETQKVVFILPVGHAKS